MLELEVQELAAKVCEAVDMGCIQPSCLSFYLQALIVPY